jgi:hypothetical protein
MSPYRKKLLKNIEVRVLPYSVLILMVVAGLTTMFFVLPPHDLTVSATVEKDAGVLAEDLGYFGNVAYNSSSGLAYLFGGKDSNADWTSNIYEINITWNATSESWDTLVSDTGHDLADPANEILSFYAPTQNKIYVVAGVCKPEHTTQILNVYSYDPSSGVSDTSANSGVRTTSGCYDNNSDVFWLVGGRNQPLVTQATIQYFDPSDETFNDVADLTDADGGKALQGIVCAFDYKTNTVWAYSGYDGSNEEDDLYEINVTNKDNPTVTRYADLGTIQRACPAFFNSSDDSLMLFGGEGDVTEGNISKVFTSNQTYFATGSSFHSGSVIINNGYYYDGTGFHIIGGLDTVWDGAYDDIWHYWDNISESPTEGTYEISGLSDSDFDFSGEADTTVWSTGNETMSIHTNLSGTTENCTDIFIDLKDGIDVDIDEEAFVLVSIRSSDGAWGSISSTLAVTDGGNMTINETTWDSGVSAGWAHGTNPFPIDDTNATIDVRMRVTIPAGKATGTYDASDWEVVWKTIT